MARSLGQKGVATIVPFSSGKGLFFVETIKEALFLQDLRLLNIEGGITVQLRRWSPKKNSEVEGKFKGGWVELQGPPFHLWSEVHLKKIVEQWGTVTEIDWRTLKLFDLSKARVRISMKERSVLLALIEVIDGDWMFTISIAVVGAEDVRRGRVMGESTWEAFASHSGTGGERQVERERSTTGESSCVGAASKKKKGGERIMIEVFPARTRGKRGQVVGNSRFQPHSSPILNSNILNIGPVGTEKASIARAGGDEAYSVEVGHQASERKAQSLPNPNPMTDAKVGCNLNGPFSKLGQRTREKKPSDKNGLLRNEEASTVGKGNFVSKVPDVQTRGSANKEVKFGSKKLWTTLFPPSFDRLQGHRSRGEPLMHVKPSSDSEESPKEEAFEAGSQLERGFNASPLMFCRSSGFQKRCFDRPLMQWFCAIPLLMKRKKDFWAEWGLIIVVHQSWFFLLIQKLEVKGLALWVIVE